MRGAAAACLWLATAIAGAAASAAAGPPVQVVPPTGGAPVAVRASEVLPRTVTIGVGGRVLWTNTTKRRHRLTSATGSWPSQTITPRGKIALRFLRAGTYPYQMDGQALGVVLVTGPAPHSGRSAEGSYQYWVIQPIPQAGGTQYQTANLAVQLKVEGGKVTGTISGPTWQRMTQPKCPSTTVAPGHTQASVSGTITDKVLELKLDHASWRQPQLSPCGGGVGPPAAMGAGLPGGLAELADSIKHLDRTPDGRYVQHYTRTFHHPTSTFTVESLISVQFKSG